MDDDTMIFNVDLRSITVEVFQEVDALLAEIEREREQGSTFHTGGTIPPCPDKLAHLIVDSVLSRHVVESMGASRASWTSSQTSGPFTLETRWMPPSYDEVREVDRAMARRDRPRATARQVAERLEAASKITSETGE